MATKENELVRKAVDIAPLEQITDEKFVNEAKKVLGYGVLSSAWTLLKGLQILKTLGIEPFEMKKLEAYKEAKAHKLDKKTSERIGSYGDRRYTTIKGVWKLIELEDYSREIPAFAIMRAAELKKALNKANIRSDFYVEELQTTKNSRVVEVPRPDPFMVVKFANATFHIDVWDEPTFEGRRTK